MQCRSRLSKALLKCFMHSAFSLHGAGPLRRIPHEEAKRERRFVGPGLREFDMKTIVLECRRKVGTRSQQTYRTHFPAQVGISAIQRMQAQFAACRPTQHDSIQYTAMRRVADIVRVVLLLVGVQCGTRHAWSDLRRRPAMAVNHKWHHRSSRAMRLSWRRV